MVRNGMGRDECFGGFDGHKKKGEKEELREMKIKSTQPKDYKPSDHITTCLKRKKHYAGNRITPETVKTFCSIIYFLAWTFKLCKILKKANNCRIANT